MMYREFLTFFKKKFKFPSVRLPNTPRALIPEECVIKLAGHERRPHCTAWFLAAALYTSLCVVCSHLDVSSTHIQK